MREYLFRRLFGDPVLLSDSLWSEAVSILRRNFSTFFRTSFRYVY